MAVRWLKDTMLFPPLVEANSDGLLAFGGDLSSERVLLAYENGIFPWCMKLVSQLCGGHPTLDLSYIHTS